MMKMLLPTFDTLKFYGNNLTNLTLLAIIGNQCER